ncbi:MAG: TetR/AcrR family transcriptional regulator [Solirubrobacteraceae bacterium]
MYELFHVDGIRATGIDTVTARAEVAPTTLYRLFGSKDELVAVYADRCSERYKAVRAQPVDRSASRAALAASSARTSGP